MRALTVLLLLLGIRSTAARAQDTSNVAVRRAADTRLRPGDQIALSFLRERDLNNTVTVDERGTAVFPKLGTIPVDHMSITQLQDTLRTRYAEYLRAPEIQISVLRRVVVNGEVRGPNVYLVDAATTLRDVIARAGGLTGEGSKSKVVVIRGNERIPVRDWDTEAGGYFALQSGDQVNVGRKNWFAMNALSLASTGVLVASFIITLVRK
jgi:polysaccharide export outer membrane protein